MKRLGLAAAATSLLVGGCGTANQPDDTRSSPTPHGYVEGAEEAAEPQRRLVYADADGTIGALNPVDENNAELAEVPDAERLATDGRFVFAAAGDTATVIDTGVWTVDHGDHRHYYRAEPRELGTVDTGDDLTVVGDTAVTVLNSADGVTVLDRSALDDGRIEPAAKPSAVAALPFAGRLLAADADGTIDVLTRTGAPDAKLDTDCPGARTPAVTDRGAVFGCDDGTVIVTDTDGELHADKVAHPDSAPDGIATGFGHRPGTPRLGAVGDDGAALVLDVAERTWIELDTPPAVAVTGTGEEGPVLALTDTGRLHSFDTDGEPTGDKSILEPIGDEAAPVIQVDTERAYLTDPDTATLYEIDYADDLRVARELGLDATARLLVETGW